MRGSMIGGPVVLALCALAAPASAASVELKNLVARVVIIPEARSDVSVTIVKTNPRLPIMVVQGMGERTVVESNWRRRWWWLSPFGSSVGGCGWEGDQPVVRVFGIGAIVGDDLPKIVVRTPMDARVEAGGAVFGDVGRSDSLDLGVYGCGKWTVANVQGRLKLDDAGSSSVRTGTAGELKLSIAGSGDVTTRAIANGYSAKIAGSGEIDTDQASGPVRVEIAGHGDVRIGGGHASSLDVHIAGSGDVEYKGVADNLNAQIAGSGDITVAKVTGTVSKSIAGAGTVTVGP